MRIRTWATAAAMIPALVLSFGFAESEAASEGCTPLEGDSSENPVLFCESAIWGQCDNAVGDSQTGVGKVILPVEGITLADTEPTGSYTEGQGCGTVDEPYFGATAMGASAYEYDLQGFIEAGNVDSLTFELHFLGPNTGYAGENIFIDAKATLDGVSLFGDDVLIDVTGEAHSSPKRRRLELTPVVSDSGLSSVVRFTVTDIADLDPELFASEPGAGSAFRVVELQFNYPHTGDCQAPPPNGTDRCAPFGPSPLVLGAAEIPTGAYFNQTADLGTLTVAGEPAE